jgi:ribose transport system permease protein
MPWVAINGQQDQLALKVNRVLLFVYGVRDLLAGLAGILSSNRLYSATGMLGNGYELDAIAAVILGSTSFTGGIGTMPGTLLGALIIAVRLSIQVCPD